MTEMKKIMFSLAFMATTLVLAAQTTDYKVIVDCNGRAGRRHHSQGTWLQNSRKIRNISLLGSSETVQWAQEKDKLTITCPSSIPCEEAIVYKVTLR